MKKILSRADEMVLLTIWRLQNNAYGVTIRKMVIEATGQDWSVGAIYDSLERLTNWEYLTTHQSDPTPERGGKRKRFYQISEDGMTALNNLRKVQETMWTSISDLSTDTN
ncbi:PadR family transcriptional regulator [Bacteroidota bacterium]